VEEVRNLPLRASIPRREFSVVRLVIGLTIAAHVILAAWWVHGAWTQVRDLDVQAPPGAIRAGWRPLIRVVTSGRKDVRVLVLLEQGPRTDTIAVHRIGANRNRFWDLQFVSRTFSPRVSRTQAGHFSEGQATLRVEAHGDALWVRTPPPVIREIPVRIARS
jgi:hypothetical protein